MKQKGFSLIEIIIVIAITGVLTAITFNSFHKAQYKKEQGGIVQAIAANLEKQKTFTQAGKDGSMYGAKFATSSYVLYTGSSYSANSSSNNTVQIDSDFTISETIANSNNTIFFSRLYGEANETATITVSHITNQVTPQYIVIEQSGTISVIE